LNIPRRCIAAFVLCLLLAASETQAQVTVHYPDRAWSLLSYGGSVWIGTPNGLHRYRSEDNVWSAYGKQNGLLSSRITSLDIRGDVLWIGQAAGLTAFDQRSNTMLHYDSSKGLNIGAARAVLFEDEYVWAGGLRGAARYDNLIEEWQSIGASQGLEGSVIHAFAMNEDRVYIADGRGVHEYDPRHERLRMFSVPGEDSIRDAFNAGGMLWLLRDGDLLRFDMATRVFSPYRLPGFSGGDIREIIIQGSGFWLVTDDELWNYDAAADALRPFPEIALLPDRHIKAVALSADGYTLWFSTASGVTRYDRGSGSWTHFTSANGLPDIDINILFSIGNGVATFSPSSLVYYRQSDDRWYELPLQVDEAGEHARFSLDPAQGSYADFGGGIRLDLSGSRSSWLFQDPLMQDEFVYGRVDPVSRNDLKARLDLGGGRRVSAMYNDADYEDVVYGAEYRGARDDIVQSFQWGDMRVQGSGSLLQQDFGIFGVGGRAVYGERTEKYGRSMLEVQTQSGHKTTAAHTDVFQGFIRERKALVEDTDWLRRTWYHLRADRRLEALGDASVQLFRPLYASEPRILGDLVSTSIAGKFADWRPYDEGRQYEVDAGNSTLMLYHEQAAPILAVRIIRGGVTTELLLCDTTGQYLEIRNIYQIGSDIVPSSLQVKIIGPGGEVPLSQFGVDSNGDGRVDAEYLDYSAGLLRFPGDQPFPAGAYQEPGVVTYTMDVRYESRGSGSYSLSKRRIIRGSEKVMVDGMPATAGEDYILDYSSGHLLFTRDGAVLEDSRVEISYEYVRVALDERFAQANLSFSPSDFTQASFGAGMFHYGKSASVTQFVQGGGELRWQTSAFDLRVRPEYRQTTSDSSTGNAAGMSATFSTDAARISVLSSLRSGGYREPVASSYAAGRLKSDHAVKGEYDITSGLRAFVSYHARAGTDTTSGTGTDESTASGGIQWSRQDYPSITLRGDYLNANDRLGDRTRHGGRLDAAWTPSTAFLELSGFSAARFSGYARISEENVALSRNDGKYRSQNYFFRSVLNPRQLLSINVWYQGDMREKRSENGAYLREHQTEKANIDILMEHISGLSLSGRLTRDVRQMPVTATLLDQSSSTSLQTNARIAPGTWLPALQPFTLYGYIIHSVYGYRRNSTESSGMLQALFSQGGGEQRSEGQSTWYDSRLEWRPVPGFLYSVNGHSRHFYSEQYRSSGAYSFWSMTHYAEWRPDNRSLYAMQFHFRRDQGNDRTDASSPAIWTERRFSRRLLLRLALHSSIRNSESNWGISDSYEIQPSGTLTFTLDDAPVIRRAELRVDGGYSFHRSHFRPWYASESVSSSASVNSNLYLDLYPHPVMFIRFRYFLVWNAGYSFQTYRIFGIDGWKQPDAELQIVMQL